MSDDSQFVVTLGRSGRVVKRAGSDLDDDFADSGRIAGKKRSVKDRLGNGLDNTYKRQRGGSSQENHRNVGLHDSQLGKNDLRFKLLEKNMSRRAENEDPPSNMDLRDTLLRKTRQSATGSKVVHRPEPTIRARESVPERRDALYSGRKSPVDHIDAYDGRRRTMMNPRDDYNDGRRRVMVNPENRYDDRRRHVFEAQKFNDERRQGMTEPRDKYGEDRRHMLEYNDIYSDGRRSMLQQVSSSRNVHDLPVTERARISHSSRPLDSLDIRRRSPDGLLRPSSSRVLSPERNLEDLHRRNIVRAYEDRKPNSYMPNDVLGHPRAIGSTSLLTARRSTHAATSKPVSQFPHPSIGALKIMHPAEIPTVDEFLRCLGLEKYAINFKAEEVDMHALRQMSDFDLKEMSVPLGPRKKILQALMPRPKRQV